jgi:hypothetical protein
VSEKLQVSDSARFLGTPADDFERMAPADTPATVTRRCGIRAPYHLVRAAAARTKWPAQHRRLPVDLDEIVEIPILAGELPRPAGPEHSAVAGEIACRRSPILWDAVPCLAEFSRMRRHSVNAAVVIVDCHADPGMTRGFGGGNTIRYLK